MDYLAVLVAQNLKLDMTRMLEELLRVDVRGSKCLLALAARRFVGVQKLFLLVHHAHASPAATRGSLDDQRKTNSLGFFGELLFPFHNAFTARNRGHAQRLHFPARTVFFTHHLDDFGSWANKGDLRGFAHLCEVGVFRKK